MKNLLLPILLCARLVSIAQSETILIDNGSFEKFPGFIDLPHRWHDCGFEGETPPDWMPHSWITSYTNAYKGTRHLGMVTRDNDTWESVSQKLKQPLQKGKCYMVEIWLARSMEYLSKSRTTSEVADYITPIKLRLWGGSKRCQNAQLLGETGPIAHASWESYLFCFTPEENYKHFILEA